MNSAPVLILFFNRPDALRAVLERVEAAAPRRVYLACDGPREGRADDAELTERCRRIALERAWKSPPATRFLASNEGCARAVSGAISWFFEREPEGIVLEDDCVPDPSFFRYATELLERYRGDERVMSIDGASFDMRRREQGSPSYRFSRCPHVWGWASWARAWQHYRLRLTEDEVAALPADRYPAQSAATLRGWRRKFRSVAHDRPATWDYQWTFAHLRRGGLVASPTRNLVTNVPMSTGAHMAGRGLWQGMAAESMEFPLRHPGSAEADRELDAHVEAVHCNHRPWLARKLHQVLVRHRLLSDESLRRGFTTGARGD